jgi:hypothetical protein
MTYLISQIFLSLVVAFILGLLFGYLLSRIFGRKHQDVYHTNEDDYGDADDVDDIDSGLDDHVHEEVPSFRPAGATAAAATATAGAAHAAFDDDDAAEMATISLDTSVNLDADEYLIETLEGIGPQTGNLFREYGIHTVGDFLRKLHRPASRDQAAKDLNILVKPLHDWASMADLLRVEGIDHQWAELTLATGITTIGELANSNANDLVAEMTTVNSAGKQLVAPTVPNVDQVNAWINKAKNMSPVITVV